MIYNFTSSAIQFTLALAATVRDFFNPKGVVAGHSRPGLFQHHYGRSRTPGKPGKAGAKLARMAEAHAIGKRGRVANS